MPVLRFVGFVCCLVCWLFLFAFVLFCVLFFGIVTIILDCVAGPYRQYSLLGP